MKPTKSILDPTFRYVPAAQQDVRKTWARFRREQAAEAKIEQAAVKPVGSLTVVALTLKDKRKA